MKNIYKWLLVAGGAAACATAGYCYLNEKNKDKPRLTLPNGCKPTIIEMHPDTFEEIKNKYSKSFDPIVNKELIKKGRMGHIYGCEIQINEVLDPNESFAYCTKSNFRVTTGTLLSLIDICVVNDMELNEEEIF